MNKQPEGRDGVSFSRMTLTKKEIQFLRDSLDIVIYGQEKRMQQAKKFEDKLLAELVHKEANGYISQAHQLRARMQNEIANFGLV